MLASPSQTARLVDLFLLEGIKEKFNKGDFVIRPGETPSYVFYIKKGLVKAYDITKYNEENLLIIRKEHEIFPLIWALTGKERQVIYQSLANTITYKISQDKLLKFLYSDPETFAPMLDMTVEMYRLHSERILNLEYRTVRERIISFLIAMSKRFATKEINGEVLIEVPLRHQDIASSVNASRETTSREMSSLEKKGLISRNKSMIVLKDIDRLKKIVE